MILDEVIDGLMMSMAADGLSPFPGFFTLATITRFVFHEWEGKGREDRFGQRSPSPRQISAIKKYLDNHYERKRSGTRTYYGRTKRR